MTDYMKTDKKRIWIVERSPLSCLYVFGKSLLENDLLSELDYKLLEELNDRYGWLPEHRIYIQTPPEICYERMTKRNRISEGELPLDYLKDIHERYEYVRGLSYGLCYIVSGEDSPEIVCENVIAKINEILG
jgi:thymidylate kinase